MHCLPAMGNTTHYIPRIMQSDWMKWTRYGIIAVINCFDEPAVNDTGGAF